MEVSWGGQPPVASEHAKYSAYVMMGTPNEIARAPKGPRNSYEVVFGLSDMMKSENKRCVTYCDNCFSLCSLYSCFSSSTLHVHMALAQRLNELAVANSEGLLQYAPMIWWDSWSWYFYSDDEYRLLRQNLFEQYSGNATIPVESPLVPITAIYVQRGCKPLAFILRCDSDISPFTASKGYTSTPTSKPIIDQHKPALDHRKLAPSRTKKLSATSGMVNLIRKATGRKPPAAVHETPLTKDTRRGDNVVNYL